MQLLSEFINELIAEFENKAYFSKTLGVVEGEPIILLQNKRIGDCPNLLVAAGFHGDEPAGILGILHFIKHADKNILNKVNLSFLPLVNPTGFKANKHENFCGENPNRGFYQNKSETPSVEGRILLENIQLLKSLAKDGFISLHEDIDKEEFYLYAFEDSNIPGKFSKSLRDELAKFFKQHKNGLLYDEGEIINEGIVFRYDDGSFEDYLYSEGIPYTAYTETPGLCGLEARINANANLINMFVKFSVNNKFL